MLEKANYIEELKEKPELLKTFLKGHRRHKAKIKM
jgi:hypothetical protein